MSFAMMVKFEIARNAARILPGFMHTRPQSEQEHQTDRAVEAALAWILFLGWTSSQRNESA